MISTSESRELRTHKRRITLVGPDPRHSANAGHAGGQLTAATGIAGYAATHGIELDVIDTYVDSLSQPSLATKVRSGMGRVRELRRRLAAGETSGVMLFVGARHSFFERVLLAGIARAKGVATAFCIRDGAFIGWMQRSAALRAIVPRLLRIPGRIVVQGSRAKDALVSAGVPAERFAVVRNWLPESIRVAPRARAVLGGEAVRFVYAGWLVKEKGLRELVHACATLASRYQFSLELIGGGPLEGELRETAAARGLTAIHFSGWLSRDEVADRLEHAHVFVLPSYFEGFPNALLEAMAHGLPSVCSDVGAIGESVRNGVNGYVVPSHDAPALAAALEHYLVSPALVSEHGEAALSVVRTLHDRETNLTQLFSCLSSDAPVRVATSQHSTNLRG